MFYSIRILRDFNESGSSGSGNSRPQLTPDQLLSLYGQALPSVLGTTNSQVAPTAQALGGAAAGANPLYTASGLSQLNSFAPGYQQTGANLADAQALSTAGLLNGPGAQVAGAANTLNNAYNPAQVANNNQAANLVNSVNLNGLSGGEQSAVERSLNQNNFSTGNLGLLNPTNTISNAVNFGGAFNQKLGILGSALGSSQNVASGQNTAFNPINTALGAGNTSTNFGLGTFNPTQANNNLTTPFSYSSTLFGPLSSNASSQVSSNNNNSQSAGGGVGGGSCYLTTVCCEYMGLKDDCEELQVLRKFRDDFVPENVVSLYYQEAPSIVEQIQNNRATLDYVFSVVKCCTQLIREGLPFSAMNLYKDMVIKLQKETLLKSVL